MQQCRRRLRLLCVALVRWLVRRNIHFRRIGKRELLTCDVRRNIDNHRTRSSRDSNMERLSDDARQVCCFLRQEAVLHHRHGDAHRVGFLERICADNARRHLAGNNNQRNAVQVCVCDSRNGVGRTRAASNQNNANVSCGARKPISFVNGGLLMARKHVHDLLRVVQSIVHGNGLSARISEHMRNAFALQRGDNRLSARHAHTFIGGMAPRPLCGTHAQCVACFILHRLIACLSFMLQLALSVGTKAHREKQNR